MQPEMFKTVLKSLAEEAIPSREVDLWPAIRNSLETGKPLFKQGDASMNTHFARTQKLRLFALATLSLLVMVTILFVTPVGRAWAQSVLLFFTRTGNTITIPTQEPASLVEIAPPPAVSAATAPAWPTATPRPETLLPIHETCGSLPSPRCTLEQIKNLVDFPVQGLSDLPEGFAFIGASGSADNIILMYEGERGALYLAQTPANQDSLQNWEIADNTLVEAVFIGSQPGEYIQGGWSGLGLPEAGALEWKNESARQTLRWEQDKIRYTLWFYAYKTGNGPALDKAGLVELASKLTDQPPITQAVGQAAYLTIQQAENMAGFAVVEPGWLPAGYTLLGASYAADHNAICLHYRYHLEASAPTLTIFESYGWLPSVEDVKIKQSYNGQPIDIPVSIVSWQLHGAENDYATWATNGVNLGPVCGSIEVSTNKVLLWRANTMNFILGGTVDQFDGRGFLSNLEMQQIAESLAGNLTLAPEISDPERLASPAALKSLASFAVRTPTRMLANLHFDHAVYLSAGSHDNPFSSFADAERAIMVYLGSPFGDGSIGYSHLFISQDFGGELPTLDELALGGGYEAVSVNQQPALFRQSCWDDPRMGTLICTYTLDWYENGVWIEMDTWLEKALSKEMLIAIAEGLR